MKDYKFLPTVNNDSMGNRQVEANRKEAFADGPCPCCGYITIPNQGDAVAYICPICFWEIDLFINSESEPSDQNNGLTLKQARDNFAAFGAVSPWLKQCCRAAKAEEIPKGKRDRAGFNKNVDV